MGNTNKKKKIALLGTLALLISVLLIPVFSNEKIDRESLAKNLDLINKECNSVYEDIENSEIKYKKLLEEEEDYFKRGMYASVLTQIYVIDENIENIIKYDNIAQQNYGKLKNGEYYIIADKKYIAWSMLRAGKYPESFKVASEILGLLNTSKNGLFIEEEVLDTKVLVNSIFLYIYSHFEILDKAQVYYDKLSSIKMTEALESSKGDKIAASKMMYAEKIGDFELMKKYAIECYEIGIERDKKNGTNFSDAMLTNIAYSNIKLGIFDECLEQLKKTEEISKIIKDNNGLITNYANYAMYYEATNEVELATRYYKKTLKLYDEAKNYCGLEDTLNSFINFLEKNETSEDIDIYYRKYNKLNRKIKENSPTNEFLLQVMSINDELNRSSVALLEEKALQNEQNVLLAIVVILLLGLMISRMQNLIRVKKESEKKLEAIANTDYLTGLNTRAYGEKLILKEMKRGVKLSIAVIDIDHFKNINDTYGHIFGDFILKEVAKYIKDSLGESAIITRFGGEEFTIAFKEKDEHDAKVILDRIREDINSMTFDNNAKVSFSAGIVGSNKTSIVGSNRAGMEILIKQADELLYEAKREGRNKVLV
ncbi:MAG: tetratricopeptide repeat-containing diguanylate cyclase [Sarcina sp.]